MRLMARLIAAHYRLPHVRERQPSQSVVWSVDWGVELRSRRHVAERMIRLTRVLPAAAMALAALLEGVALLAALGAAVPVASAQTARCGFILGFETLRG